MAAAGEASEPLKYQTWVLKVSIHCEGCKRTVKKSLQSIDGVYKTTIDSQQHKVMVTGNVSADTLIKKLLKIGKHAELWPETKPKNQNAASPAAAAANKNNNNNNNNGGNNAKKKNKNTNEGSESSPTSHEDSSNTPKKPNKPETETPESAAKQHSNSESKDATPNENASAKKGKKGKKGGNFEADTALSDKEILGALGEAEKAIAGGSGGDASLPRPPPAYHLPVVGPPAAAPAYVMSYNTSHPSASYGAAYYPITMQHSGCGFYSAYSPPGSFYAPPIVSSPSVTLESPESDEDSTSACVIM